MLLADKLEFQTLVVATTPIPAPPTFDSFLSAKVNRNCVNIIDTGILLPFVGIFPDTDKKQVALASKSHHRNILVSFWIGENGNTHPPLFQVFLQPSLNATCFYGFGYPL